MHILFVSRQAYAVISKKPDGVVFGGAEVQMVNLAQYMASQGHETDLIVRTFLPPFEQVINKVTVINYSRRKARQVVAGIGSFVSFIRILLERKPDVLVCRLPEKVFWLSVIYAKLCNKKTVYMIAHDEVVSKKSFPGLSGALFKIALQNTDLIFVQNTFQEESVRDILQMKPVLLQNSFFLQELTSYNKKYILWVGRSETWKRPEIFIELAKSFSEEKFVMVCTKNKQAKYWQEIKDKAEQVENITFIEQVSIEENQVLYNNAKVFVNTSSAEGFPNSFINAGQAKTPILSLSVNPNNIFDAPYVGVLAHDSEDELRAGLSLLLQNEEQYKKYSEGVFSYVHETHNIEKNGKLFEKEVLALLETSSPK